MNIEPIGTQSVLLETMNQLRGEATITPADRIAKSQVNFTEVMQSALNRVSDVQNAAAHRMVAVETGQSDDLVGAMVASQKAGLSFSALVQVRNKLVSAFDDIMRMPV